MPRPSSEPHNALPGVLLRAGTTRDIRDDDVTVSHIPGLAVGLEEELIRKNIAARMFNRPLEPELIGERYVLRHAIGRGAKGTVFLAEDQRLHRTLAIKLLHEHGDSEERTRLLREGQALAELKHPNVVQVFDADNYEDQVYLVMEHIDGCTLREWERDETRTWKQILDAYRQAGAGLLAAHKRGFAHRDFKPENALVERETGRVCVADFGLVKRQLGLVAPTTEHSSQLLATPTSQPRVDNIQITATHKAAGTPLYMARESLFQGRSDERSDQFSFCVSLYLALYGTYPLTGGTPPSEYGDLIAALDAGVVYRPKKTSRVPQWVFRVLARGLHSVPEQRYPSMAELLAALDHRWKARRIFQGIAGTTLIAAGVAFGLVVSQSDPPSPPCAGAQQAFAEAWNPDVQARILTSFQATAIPEANTRANQVAQALDIYADKWTETHTNQCRKTRVHQDQSEQVLEGQMQCLHGLRNEVALLVDQLENPTPDNVRNAARSVASLTEPATCVEFDTHVPPPGLAEEVAHIEEKLAQARTDARVGRLQTALGTAQAAASEAPKDYRPIHARAWIDVAEIAIRLGDGVTAHQALDQAMLIAEAGKLHDLKAIARILDLKVLGFLLQDTEKAQQAALWADAAITASRNPPSLRATYHNNLGLSLIYTSGNYPAALESLHLAHNYRAGENPLDEIDTLVNLGNVHHQLGEYEQATAYLNRGLELEDSLNSEPSVHDGRYRSQRAALYLNLATVQASQKNYTQALRSAEQSRSFQPPESPLLLETLRVIAKCHTRRENHREAFKYWQQVVDLTRTQPDPSQYEQARAHKDLGLAYYYLKNPRAAADEFEQAIEIWEQIVDTQPQQNRRYFVTALVSMAYTSHELGHKQQARQALARADEVLLICPQKSRDSLQSTIDQARAALGLSAS